MAARKTVVEQGCCVLFDLDREVVVLRDMFHLLLPDAYNTNHLGVIWSSLTVN